MLITICHLVVEFQDIAQTYFARYVFGKCPLDPRFEAHV